MGSPVGTAVIIHALHHCDLGSIQGLYISQSDSEGFCLGSPVFLPLQKSSFLPKSVSLSVLITRPLAQEIG